MKRSRSIPHARLRALLVSVLYLSLVGSFRLCAQREQPKNRIYADLKLYHFGFFIGMDLQDMKLVNTGLPTSNGRILYGDVASWSPGFVVGIVGNLNLSPYFDLRLLPALHFGDKPIAFSDGEKEIESFSLRSNYLTLPLELKYSSLRLNNLRPYVSAGIYGSMELGRKKGTPLYLRAFDYGVQMGIGCDFYLPYFKLCPQLTFRYGFPNVVDRNRPDLVDDPTIVYTEAIKRGSNQMVMLTFSFE